MIAFIRSATLEDLPEILNLESKSFKEGHQFSRRQFYYAIQKGNGYFRIYEELGGIFGYIYVLANGRIYSIATIPNRGIGKILLTRAEEFVITILNKKIIKLEVREDNKKAINFYIKHGYKSYGIKHNYYSDGCQAILMRKDLNSDAQGRLA